MFKSSFLTAFAKNWANQKFLKFCLDLAFNIL